MRIIYDKTRDWWVDDSWVGEWSNIHMNPISLGGGRKEINKSVTCNVIIL